VLDGLGERAAHGVAHGDLQAREAVVLAAGRPVSASP